MTSRLSGFLERWVARNRVSEEPTANKLQSSFAQLEQLILMSASPLSELEPPNEAAGSPDSLDAADDIRGWEVSSDAIRIDDAFDADGSGFDPNLPTDIPAFEVPGGLDFSGVQGDYYDVPHSEDMQLTEGTIVMNFTADDIFGRHALFSKDYSGNREGGDLTALVENGRIKIRFQSADTEVWLKSAEGSIRQGQDYHLAFSFGSDGAWLYLNGEITDWEYDFTEGLEQNTQNMAIGANTWSRNESYPDKTWDHFNGQISDFMIFGTQYSHGEITDISGYAKPELSTPTVNDEGVLQGTNNDDHLDAAAHGVTEVHGGYGDDTIIGTDGDDVLDGGHGEDRLEGGDGNDLLISRADGREPEIAQNYTGEDDPNDKIDPLSNTYYSDQPIVADDVLIGGRGADTFRFEVLINAKPEKILDHVMDNGMIHWHGVAGENDNVHDHWVDVLGREVIWDFNRAEGDKIEVIGHTVDVYKLEHVDTDGDGILDASVLYVQSNQGNAGAHNKDKLGEIWAFGDLVMESDYTVDSKPAYGIVDHVRDLEEAITPIKGDSVADGDAPPPTPEINDGDLPTDGVFGMLNEVDFNGEDHVEVAHDPSMELSEGTFALTVTADDVFGYHALFSKDFTGNRDGGDLTAFVVDGRVKVRFQSNDDEVWLRSAAGSIVQGHEHHVAVTFGDDGFWLYVDGEMKDWDLDFTQGLENNTQDMAIGANTWNRTNDQPNKTSSHFDGQISDFVIFDSQYDHGDIATLSGNPPAEPLNEPEVRDGVLLGSINDDRLVADDYGIAEVHGGYGDDAIIGTDHDDVLNGGHGEDRLEGGEGNDLLISRSDGREPEIAQSYTSEDDPDSEIDPNTRTYYSNQPIVADDVMVGGGGADTFRFEVLINAKLEKILDHVMDNGTIHWHGVAGENDEVHDHWVDRLGTEVIWDFNRAEGDKIEVVGHTVDVHKVEHVDTNGNGVLDASVLYVQSNQGNAGAHNKDQLGEIWVFGDLVLESDYSVDAKPAYGIVDNIRDLGEAISPLKGDSVADGDAPPPTPDVNDGSLPLGGVFGMLQEVNFEGEDHIEVAHTEAMQLSEGTIGVTFIADDIWGYHTLFSKDYTGNRDGGDLTAFVVDGRVKVRLQSVDDEVWLYSEQGSIQQGQEHHVAVTFGNEGFWLYVDGEMKDWDLDFTQGLEHNTQNMAIGANTWSRTADHPHRTWHHFDGQISDFQMFDTQYDHGDVATLSGNPPAEPLTEPEVRDGVLLGSINDDQLNAADHGVTEVHGGYGDDTIIGSNLDDVLNGGHGEDRLEGGDGNDLLISRSDGREPEIAQNYTSDDDPDSEIDQDSRTYYADQPIVADDVLVGGGGADTFRFEVLINAKPEKILKHTMDNGMIHWHGVAGENDSVHDHWVDRLGNEVIWDFNRAEGDKIEVVGHTVDVYKLEHHDTDGDGILDASVLFVQSNQGNAGAHNKDQLGTITVFGDLVMDSDYSVDAKPAYGIVDNIRDLDEAIAPLKAQSVADGDAPPPAPDFDDGQLPAGGVFGLLNEVEFSGEEGDYIGAAHTEDMALTDGTIAMTFTPHDVFGRHALFSKDFTGNGEGGHLTAFIENGQVKVRLQSADSEVWLKTAEGSVLEYQEYELAVTFGADGFGIYLDGTPVAWNSDFTQGLGANSEAIAIGASTWSRNADRPYATRDHFDGVIRDFVIYDSQLNPLLVSG